MERLLRKSKKPTVAGILMLVAVVLTLVFVGVPVARDVFYSISYTGLDWFTWFVSPLPFLALAAGFGGSIVIANILTVIFPLSILLAIAGGILALTRRGWELSIAGSVGALLCTPVLGIVALSLTITARDEFLR